MTKKQMVYNVDSAPKYLPQFDITADPGKGVEIPANMVSKLLDSGLWSTEKPGGNKK